MTDHLRLMTAKVAMLEQIVTNMLASSFEAMPDPVAAAHSFAESYRRIWENRRGADRDADLLFAEVWNEFLDGVVAEVQRRSPPQS